MDIAHADPRLAAAYERGNDLPGASLRAWAHLITSQLVDADRILEVGAGTGIFCAALAEQVPQAEIVGVDPSEPMLAEAARHHGHPGSTTGSAPPTPCRWTPAAATRRCSPAWCTTCPTGPPPLASWPECCAPAGAW